MTTTPASLVRPQSRGEEIANAVSHGVGALAAIALLPVLVVTAWRSAGASAVVGASVFGATVALLYLASTVYHALPAGRAKRVFLVLDHSAIFALIAGTYTPFTLGALRGAWGWSLFGAVWGMAIFGIVMKAVLGPRCQALTTCVYLAMGWLVLLAAGPLWANVPLAGIAWLAGGGIAYTVGVLFFALDGRVRYAHFVWHLFVLAGTACHVVAVIGYAA